MKVQAERLVVYAFSIGLLILLIISIFSYSTTERLIRANREVYRRQEALRNMETLLSILKDAETGKRGYQLTNNKSYLEPYNAAVQRLNPQLDRLHGSIVSEPERMAEFNRLKVLIALRMKLLTQSLQLLATDPNNEEKQLQISREGKPAMDNVRAIIKTMEDAEQKSLQLMKRKSEDAAHRTVLVIGFGIGLGFSLAVVAALLIRLNLQARKRAEEQLQAAHDQLEIKVRERTAELQVTTELLAQKNRALQTTSECNQILVRASDEGELLSEICRAIVTVGGYPKAWVGFTVSEDNLRIASVATRDGLPEKVEQPAIDIAKEAVRNQTPQTVTGPNPLIALPLLSENYSLGALSIHVDSPGAFVNEEVKLLTELAADLSYGLTTLRTRIDKEKAREELQKTQQLFRLFTGNLPGLAWIKDFEGRFVFINKTWEKVLQLNPREVIGKTCFELWPREIANSVRENDERAKSERFPVETVEALPDKQGSMHEWLSVRFSISDDSPLICGMAIDITERKQAEEERNLLLTQIQQHAELLESHVAERTEQLQAANRELEAFSYSVSHDLRAPLRAIDGFSKALLDDYAENLDEQAKDYLDRVRKATQRMGNLIDDLLGLSKVSRQEMRREEIDLATVAHETVEQLRKLNPERRVEVAIEPCLTARADSHLMKILLENLIGNSWKFTARKKTAKIYMGKLESNGETVYYVKDNGVGFDNNFAGRLFIPFQRLHSREEFDGTGIGLATVQRIIHRHGGRVWSEGIPGEGAAFYFTVGN